MRKHLPLILGLLAAVLGAVSAHAQGAGDALETRSSARVEMAEGLASNGLCGLAYTAYPTCPRRVGVSAGAGYGYTESVGTPKGAHHRMAGVLGVGVTPLPWLSLALRLDGRIDKHPSDPQGKNVTGTGDPRLFVRAGHALSSGLALGGEAVVWFPGNEAPSFEARATTVDLKALVAQRLSAFSLTLLGHAGVRLDQSAKSAPDLTRLRSGDRSALGLSDSHAVLLALGASTRALAASELFLELSLDWLVGSQAPAFSKSPLRATVGGRYFVSRRLQAELTSTVALNGRPSIGATAPLVPLEPRFLLGLGLRYGHHLDQPPAQVRAPQPALEPEAAPTSAKVEGVVVDANGAPLPDVTVTLRAGERQETTVTDGDGHYAFQDVALGAVALEATGTGLETQKWSADVVAHNPPLEKRAMAPKGDLGTLRVLTRSFASEPLAAAIQVRDAKGKKVASGQADAQGLAEFELPPGRYVVMISAPRYRAHQREVQIERYGVAILNVDMRAKP